MKQDPDAITGPAPAAPQPVKALYTTLDHGDSDRIAAAVHEAEVHTSSEIIVKLSAATLEYEPMQGIARAEFVRLGLAHLPLANGILIYVSLNRRGVEIVVGQEAAKHLPASLWQQAADTIVQGFRTGKPANAIIAAIQAFAGPLAAAFPPSDISGPELPNISEDV